MLVFPKLKIMQRIMKTIPKAFYRVGFISLPISAKYNAREKLDHFLGQLKMKNAL